MVEHKHLFNCLKLKHSRASRGFFMISGFILLGLLVSGRVASAEVLFEGYSKVLLGGTHVGFAVQRFEFDSKSKEFSTIYYLKTNPLGGNITESLKARASASLSPISYQFTELADNKARTIDASFRADQMIAVIKDGSSSRTLTKKVPKGAFLSSFLGYLMLQGKEGIKAGVKYSYQGIAEEDGNLYTGEAYISGEEAVNGLSAFKVLNTFKNARFISYVTYKGEVLTTRSPVQQVSTELVSSIEEATSGIQFNRSNLSALFGAVPKGSENTVSRRALETIEPSIKSVPTGSSSKSKKDVLNATPSPSEQSPKTSGVPGGKGIIIKGSPSSRPTNPTAAPTAEPTPTAEAAPTTQTDSDAGASDEKVK